MPRCDEIAAWPASRPPRSMVPSPLRRMRGRLWRRCAPRWSSPRKFGVKIEPETVKLIGMDSRPEHIRKVPTPRLKRLKTDVIDLFFQHRVDPDLPFEDVAGAVMGLIQHGKLKRLWPDRSRPCGRSDAFTRCNRSRPLQNEYSLWTRGPETNGVVQVCEELGIGFVAYRPLAARGRACRHSTRTGGTLRLKARWDP